MPPGIVTASRNLSKAAVLIVNRDGFFMQLLLNIFYSYCYLCNKLYIAYIDLQYDEHICHSASEAWRHCSGATGVLITVFTNIGHMDSRFCNVNSPGDSVALLEEFRRKDKNTLF